MSNPRYSFFMGTLDNVVLLPQLALNAEKINCKDPKSEHKTSLIAGSSASELKSLRLNSLLGISIGILSWCNFCQSSNGFCFTLITPL